MASLIRPSRPYPLPANAEIVDQNGRLHVRIQENGRKVLYPVSKDGTKFLKPSKKWYGQFTDFSGVVRRVPLSPNKAAAQQMLAELVRKGERKKAGLHDTFQDHAPTPISTHLEQWEASLSAGGAGVKHIRQTVVAVRSIFETCRIRTLSELDATKVEVAIAGLRDSASPLPPLDPNQQVFTKKEAATAAGVSVVGFAALVRRHRLAAVGNGKARRYPLATVEALRRARPTGAGTRTANFYLGAVKQFCRWMVTNRRMADNPLSHLARKNVEGDRRRQRRPLSQEELRKLIVAASGSPRTFRGLSGIDRSVLYATAAATGLRAAELASLTRVAFSLDATPPTVTLAACHAKNGKLAVQPLPPDLVVTLRSYLDGRMPNNPVWPGTWFEKAAEVIRDDLELAGVPFVIQEPDGPQYADFHSLRHSYVALLDRSGATLKEAMQLARHSDPKLTAAVYGRSRLSDLGNTVAKLPALTTTSDPPTVSDALPDALVRDGGCQFVTDDESERGDAAERQGSRKGLKTQRLRAFEGELMVEEESTPCRTRTYDPLIKSQLLYQLS